MYVPSHFEEAEVDILHDLISCHPFGVLVTYGIDGLDANHIPFELDKGEGALGVLRAHVARANPLWRNVSDGDEVLAIFQAGDAYISPNWYPSKHESHKQVPTWNYKVAHAYGRIVVKDDERTVRGIVARLTKSHEVSQPVPWKMSDSPKAFIDTMVKAIVGIEIHVTRLMGKSKLSQNREPRDIRGAALALKNQGDHLIADAMLACASAKEER
ncbi:FMN-binding negative transcriptional regulator [Magnetospirillum gryphiswaldense]|uniref:Negative transcriptional regulator n=1 Tax=Magnetospirillum gryphiswaldense TaxID=55518 RepID=A4U2N8_9PROT|nr:FMN-binding negative transcriptional regulator [Magnetospirillum gryphiswaldense]AVM74778.1 Protease synthase and sporulation protein PAI 2 [Magnetospirillum gryphiswaldense MSR-1]AVM78681.1 Protease synthase and sporulation protein PAI 2 [Magnetospirillum gryphiswaldense]CAM77145.1 Negative transcriptional regulator [Magnetospirillum gryphiswaldense MSR-1]